MAVVAVSMVFVMLVAFVVLMMFMAFMAFVSLMLPVPVAVMRGAAQAAQVAPVEAAKARHPARWSGATRNWDKVEVVYLNLDNPELSEGPEVEAAAA